MVRGVRIPRLPRQRLFRRMWPLRVPLLVVRMATHETSQSLQAIGEGRHVGLT